MPDARISELPAAASPGDADLAPLVQASGATLETRRATVAQLRSAVLADRGAHVRDYGAVGNGTTNDAPAIQAAINDLKAKGGGTLSFGPRVYRIASPILIEDATIRLQGAGFTEGPGPGQGTWLRIDQTGFTPFRFTGVFARGSAVRDIAVQQAHTNPLDANWVPNDYDFVFRVEDCLGGVDFDNVFLCFVNRGIHCRNSGRLDIRRLRGQVLRTGVEIDECYDIPRIHSVHFWPFLSSDNTVIRWQQANGDAMVFRRCDGVFLDQAFALGYRSMFRFTSSAAGVTTKFYIGQAYTDFVQYGVWLEGNGIDGQIANLTHQGEIFNAGGPPLAGGTGLFVNASNTRLQVGNLRIDAAEDNAIRVNGTGNRLDIFSLRCVRYNTRNNGAAAIHLADSGAATPNAVHLGSPPLLELGHGGPLVNGGTNGVLALGAPAGRAARPGLALGSADTGLFQPAGGTLAAAAGGAEVLRASPGAITLGAAPGSHGLEVATPASAANHIAVSGAGTGEAVALQAQGADANVDLWIAGKGSGLLRTTAPPAGDTSSAVATTAWVRAQGYGTGSGGGAPAPVTSVAGRTGAVTLAVADIAGAAPLASPALTGAPTAPTPAATDSSTALATTAFVWSLPAQKQLADGTAAGGNARGANAVDWQSSRSAASQVASGTSATIGGGQNNLASGNNGTVAGGSGNIASGGAATVAGGINNTASGTYATVAGGQNNTASGGATVGGGQGNTASGGGATVAGGQTNTLSGAVSWAPGGERATDRGHRGRGAWGAGMFTTTGDAQSGEFVLRCRSTDAMPTRLTADAGAAGAANSVNLPNNATYLLRIMVVARQTAGTAGSPGDSAGWSVEVLVKRGAGAAATMLVGGGGASIAPSHSDAAAAAWRLAVAADTANGGVAVSATGEANKTIQWVARILSIETVG